MEDRFHAVVVQSGMNGRHVLGHQGVTLGDCERRREDLTTGPAFGDERNASLSAEMTAHTEEPNQVHGNLSSGDSENLVGNHGELASVSTEITARESGE
jgi:hypothetical protein